MELSPLENVEVNRVSDLIERQAAIDALKHNQDVYSHNFHDDPIDKYTTAIIATDIDSLVNLPSAQPKRKTGRWERHNTYRGDDTSGYIDPDWRCSECGRQANVNEYFMYDLTDFCPNCGADMRGDEDER